MFTQFPTWYTFPLLYDIHLHICHYAKFLAFLPPNRPNGPSGGRGRVSGGAANDRGNAYRVKHGQKSWQLFSLFFSLLINRLVQSVLNQGI